jgi:hypothetical protein
MARKARTMRFTIGGLILAVAVLLPGATILSAPLDARGVAAWEARRVTIPADGLAPARRSRIGSDISRVEDPVSATLTRRWFLEVERCCLPAVPRQGSFPRLRDRAG